MWCDTDKEKKRQVKNPASGGGGGVGRMMKGEKGMKLDSDILIHTKQCYGIFGISQPKFLAVKMRLDGNVDPTWKKTQRT